jgi:hypothetical protein
MTEVTGRRAAAESAISASGLIVGGCATYYGHDASGRLQATANRRESIDRLMREIGAARWWPAWPDYLTT